MWGFGWIDALFVMSKPVRLPPTYEIAVYMAADDDVLVVTNFVLSFPTGCLRWGLEWNYFSS